ncbi:MAG: SDR family oxidoreductase [Pseudomonadota bacterium]
MALSILIIGASSGIGEACASQLAKAGHRVFASSRDAARVSIANVTPLSIDVFNEDSVSAALEAIISRTGRLDAVVYSAGFYVAGAVEETSLADVRDQMEAYFFGAVRCAQLALPSMREQRSGRLVFMSSTAGTISIPYHSAYSASKGALGRWTEALAYETKPLGIHVSYIEAGPIRTNAPNAMKPPSAPMAIYEAARSNAEAAFKQSISGGLPPARIARAVQNAIESEKPRVRYRVGNAGKVFPFLQAMLGEHRFRKLMSMSFKI